MSNIDFGSYNFVIYGDVTLTGEIVDEIDGTSLVFKIGRCRGVYSTKVIFVDNLKLNKNPFFYEVAFYRPNSFLTYSIPV